MRRRRGKGANRHYLSQSGVMRSGTAQKNNNNKSKIMKIGSEFKKGKAKKHKRKNKERKKKEDTQVKKKEEI